MTQQVNFQKKCDFISIFQKQCEFIFLFKVLREKCMQPQDECGLTLHEAILGGALQRPIHYSELVLDVTLKWGNWGEEDRRDNYLLLKRNILYEEAIGKN